MAYISSLKTKIVLNQPYLFSVGVNLEKMVNDGVHFCKFKSIYASEEKTNILK